MICQNDGEEATHIEYPIDPDNSNCFNFISLQSSNYHATIKHAQ